MFGVANFTIKASSDDAYRRLIREFVSFYQKHLFNDHWGEQARVSLDNSLVIGMLSHGLDTLAARCTSRRRNGARPKPLG